MLYDGPSYGYELKARFEDAIGPQWGSFNIGHVYQVLDRLLRDGLAISHTQAQAVRPDRVIYEITEDGRTAVVEWLSESSPAANGYRDDLFLKLMTVARLGDDGIFLATMRQARKDLLQELRDLGVLHQAPHAGADRPLNGLLVTAAELQVNARLQLVEAALVQRKELLEQEHEQRASTASANSGVSDTG